MMDFRRMGEPSTGMLAAAKAGNSSGGANGVRSAGPPLIAGEIFDEEDDGFQFEQTAFAALNEYESAEQQRWIPPRMSYQLPQRQLEHVQQYSNGAELSNVNRSLKLNQQPQQQIPQSQQQQFTSQRLSKPSVQGQSVAGASVPAPVSVGSGNRSPASSPGWGVSLLSSVVEQNDYREAARFFLEAKSGNEAAAMDFLRGVFLAMSNPALGDAISLEAHDWDTAVRNGPPYLTPEDQAAAQAQLVMNQHNSILLHAQRLGVPPKPPPIVPVTLIGDEIDQRLATLVILVPGRAHIVGHLIGKGGAEVGRIEREMSVTIKIEAASKLNIQLVERSVCIIGTVAATSQAQQLVSHKVHEKLLSEGVQAEVLKMVVPNEIVRHLIGKNGANINRLQNESGARIQVEPESTMPSGAVGRTIVLQGAERCRTFAQYLILRQIAEDRNVHSEWVGRMPHMQAATGPGSPPSDPSAVPGPTGTFSMSQNAPLPGPSVPRPSNFAGPGSIANPHHQAPQTMHIHHQQQQQQQHMYPMKPGQQAGVTRSQQSHQVQQQQHTMVPSTFKNGPGMQHVEETSVSFNVPEQSVAYVIGKNGSSIADIQSQTGAKVQIARGGVQNPNAAARSDVRKVTIIGTPVAVDAAQYMIRQKLQSSTMGGVQPEQAGAPRRGGGTNQQPVQQGPQQPMRHQNLR